MNSAYKRAIVTVLINHSMWLRILPLLSLLAGAQADNKWSKANCAEPNTDTIEKLAARNIEIYSYENEAAFACKYPHTGQIQFTCANKDSQPKVTGKCVPYCTNPDQAELDANHVT